MSDIDMPTVSRNITDAIRKEHARYETMGRKAGHKAGRKEGVREGKIKALELMAARIPIAATVADPATEITLNAESSLSIRTYYCLQREDAMQAGALSQKTVADLLDILNMDIELVVESMVWLASMGYRLKQA